LRFGFIDSYSGEWVMDVDFDEVELGLVVNLKTLREVLKALSIGGRRWWIASDPYDAAARGYLSIGHGDQHCPDRLNTLYFRIPILGPEILRGRTDTLLLLFHPATSFPAEPGYYLENGRVMQDSLEDFMSFYVPIKAALIARLQAGD
jgi:hypothetical protein